MITAYQFIQPGFGPMVIAQFQEAICYVGLGSSANENLSSWAKRNLCLPIQYSSDPLLRETQAQLGQYFDGKRCQFQLPLYLTGTSFQLRVWSVMQLIPYGKIVTYSNIASALSKPGAVRAVGGACGANPLPIIIPCHRVVAKSGLGGFSSGLEYKKYLLEREGFTFK